LNHWIGRLRALIDWIFDMEFKAKELTKEGKLEVANYSYIPIADSIEKDPFSLFCKYSVRPSQWQIKRNGEDWMILNGNYRILQSVACGICSTDLDRVYFPFPLPQIIGHELVARYFVSGENNPKSGEWHYVCVEINDSHLAHNEVRDLSYSFNPIHSIFTCLFLSPGEKRAVCLLLKRFGSAMSCSDYFWDRPITRRIRPLCFSTC